MILAQGLVQLMGKPLKGGALEVGLVEGRQGDMQTRAFKGRAWPGLENTGQGGTGQGQATQLGWSQECLEGTGHMGCKVSGCPLLWALFTQGLSSGPGCPPWPGH